MDKAKEIELIAEVNELNNQLNNIKQENELLNFGTQDKISIMAVLQEIKRVLVLYPKGFNSHHEAIALIREEYLELEAEIFKQPTYRTPQKITTEAKQLCALALMLMSWSE